MRGAQRQVESYQQYAERVKKMIRMDVRDIVAKINAQSLSLSDKSLLKKDLLKAIVDEI